MLKAELAADVAASWKLNYFSRSKLLELLLVMSVYIVSICVVEGVNSL